eukprot:COSAG01_NODE_2831_length_6997_cov_77.941287_4_plen_150_part_00
MPRCLFLSRRVVEGMAPPSPPQRIQRLEQEQLGQLAELDSLWVVETPAPQNAAAAAAMDRSAMGAGLTISLEATRALALHGLGRPPSPVPVRGGMPGGGGGGGAAGWSSVDEGRAAFQAAVPCLQEAAELDARYRDGGERAAVVDAVRR